MLRRLGQLRTQLTKFLPLYRNTLIKPFVPSNRFFPTFRHYVTEESPPRTQPEKPEEEEEEIYVSPVQHDIGGKRGIGNVNRQELYGMLFTCGVCKTRQYKQFSKESYHTGVVIIQCGECKNLHLVADNLGWFENYKQNVEDLLRAQGKQVTKIMDGDLSLSEQELKQLGIYDKIKERAANFKLKINKPK